MPPNILANGLSVVHSSSQGMSIAFPDPCKTPAPPAPPVPIPYPNIAQSSDLAPGPPTVTFQGAQVAVQGSKILLSTGDEAGVAMGVVSNMIKGMAEFANYSFDVKVGGKNVCRFLDPLQQNMGSANAFGPAEIQSPGPVGP